MTSIEESEKKVNISFFFFYYPLKTKKNVPLWYVNTFLQIPLKLSTDSAWS